MAVRAWLMIPTPDAPPTDFYVTAVLNVFYMATRERRYIAGAMVCSPLPLCVSDITNVLDAHPQFIERSLLDPCIFAIDDLWLENENQKLEAEADSKNDDE